MDISGPNNRVIEVLNFLAAHPTESFTLSELAQRLALSNGSAHRVLSTLTQARYLSRHPKHKTYSLGVALVAIGQAALEKHRGIDIARREMLRLTRELKAQCIATAVVDDELLFLAREGAPQTFDGLNRVGERWPFLPPLGLVHVAWAERAVVDGYMDRARSTLSDPIREYLGKALRAIRQRGYAVGASGSALAVLRHAAKVPIDQRRDSAYWAHLYQLITQLSEKEIQLLDRADVGEQGISYISAPVFNPSGTVAMDLTLSGMPDKLSGRDITQYIERLRAAAAIVTSETHGRAPAQETPSAEVSGSWT